MPQTKRMSAEEKRQAILGIYHASKSVFTEKEIVTAASKAGVNANSIVDVNQSLVDDGLVDKEKIGGSNYFWSFPAKKDRMMELQHQNAVKHIDVLKKKIDETKVALMDAKRGREEDEEHTTDKTDEEAENNPDRTNDDTGIPTNKKSKTMSRAAKLARLQEIAKLKAAAETELESLKDNDPQALANLEKELQLVLQGANRWTDNIYICKSYLTKKRGMDSKQACKVLDISSAFDYPVDKVPKRSK